MLIKQFKFDKNEIKILNFHNVQTIGSLLEFRYLDDKTKKKIIMLPKIRANLFETFQSNDISLWNKLVKVVDHIKCNFVSLNIISNIHSIRNHSELLSSYHIIIPQYLYYTLNTYLKMKTIQNILVLKQEEGMASLW